MTTSNVTTWQNLTDNQYVSSVVAGSGITVSGSTGTVTISANDAVGTGANTFTGIQTAPAFSVSGLAGATAGARLVGGTASGAPTSGTFNVGDFMIDQSANIWIYGSLPASSGQFTGILGGANPLTSNTTRTVSFTVNQNIQITALNMQISTGTTSNQIAMCIFDISGNLIIPWQTAMLPTSFNGLYSMAVPTTAINANTTYYIGVSSNTGINNLIISSYGYDASSYGIKVTFASNDKAYNSTSYETWPGTTNTTSIPAVGFSANLPPAVWQSIRTAAFGVWTPGALSGYTTNSLINIAPIPSSACQFFVEEVNGGTQLPAMFGISDPSGGTIWSTVVGGTNYSQAGYSTSPNGSGYILSSMFSISGTDGYMKTGFFQIYNGYLQFHVSGTAASAYLASYKWAVR